jgi:hypothetical protein
MEIFAAAMMGGAASGCFAWLGWRSAARAAVRRAAAPRPIGPVTLTLRLRETPDPLPVASRSLSRPTDRAVADLKALARAVEAARSV